MPQVSIIIPTYRHADLVLESLASVFAQRFSDHEIIVVNDGSPDDTRERLRPLAEAGRIRYFEQVNAGQAAARNRGLAEARGEFIAFLDDDDLWPPDKLEWQTQWLGAHPDAVAVSGWCELFQTGGATLENTWRPCGTINLDSLAMGNPFHSPGQTLVRRSALTRIAGFDPGIWGADDYDLNFRLLGQGTIEVLPRVALRYRVHTGNASHDAARMFINILKVGQRGLAVGSAVERRARFCHFYRYLYNYAGLRLLRDWRAVGRGLLPAKQWLACLWLVLTISPLRHQFGDSILRKFGLRRRTVRADSHATAESAGKAP